MNKQIQQYMIFAFAIGFAFEFGGQCAWMFMDMMKLAIHLPLG
ncbi:hypothetical protein [Vibrio clamense]